MRKRDAEHQIARRCVERMEALETRLARLFVEYSEKTEKGIKWNLQTHRDVGEYQALNHIIWGCYPQGEEPVGQPTDIKTK